MNARDIHRGNTVSWRGSRTASGHLPRKVAACYMCLAAARLGGVQRDEAEPKCRSRSFSPFLLIWDDEASVWSGHCDDIPAAADAPTLDELLAKISAMALDLLPDNHPDVDPASLFLQITALREAEPAVA